MKENGKFEAIFFNILNIYPMDPFTAYDEFKQSSLTKNKYHIRVQQRNGRKCITTLDGLEEDLDLKRICKAMREAFSCNGNVVMKEDEEEGVIQLQGDQRENIKKWLLEMEIILKSEADRIVVHGF